MKKIILLLTVFATTLFYAQDKIYVHTATASNIDSNATYIDHPDLNGNPSANFVFKHVWNPNGAGTGTYNDHVDGMWYDDGANKWLIYNEDGVNMVPGAQFFVYIGSNNANFITHIADAAHVGIFDSFTVIDDPDFNNINPGPYAVMSNSWSGNFNPHNYGFFYDSTDNRRNIYSEDGATIPTNAGFKILKNGTGALAHLTAMSTAANITLNWFVIDHPALNGNPNATFVFQHYWGVNGASSQIEIDKVLSAWYTGTNWAIYTEDESDMPEGVAVDIIVANQDVLGVSDNEFTNQVTMFPNPAKDVVNISTQKQINTIRIYNLLGQEVLYVKGNSNTMQVNTSNLTTGNYIVKVEAGNAVKTLKLTKQ